MNVAIPDEILQAAGLSEQELLQEIALLLYQQNRLTLGYASRLANMYQGDFMELLASRVICIHYDVEEFEQDLQTLRKLGRLKNITVDASPQAQASAAEA